jgi:Fe-S cluster assembly protein SufD
MTAVIPKTAAEEALGLRLPNRRDEEWKWTDLRRLITAPYVRQAFTARDADIDRLIASSPLASVKTKRIVFVNGVYDAGRSQLPQGMVQSEAALADDTIVVIGNKLEAQGVALTLDDNAGLPVEIIHVATDGPQRAMGVRHSVSVANGASATLIETYVGEGDYLSNSVIEMMLGDGARLDRIKIEHESGKASHLAHAIVTLRKGAILRDFTFTSGAALNRQNGTYTFLGQEGDARISGAYLINGKQHADTRLIVDHAVPNCTSRELFQCVMNDTARGIFQGKVIVRPDAQKTDGKQSSHALLLSETAEFDAKPELEIYADDVVCGHGATAGDINHDHLFYLKSRGIPEAEAKSLLIAAFVGEAFDTIEHEGIREALTTYAEGWLARR